LSSTLLARFAENIFWLGRYVERVDNLARILDINKTYARESQGAPDWRQVLDLYSDIARYVKTRDSVGEQEVLSFYVLEGDNPGSVAASVRMARENARSIRHLISNEMWTHLNTFNARVSRLTLRDIRSDNVSGLCTEIKEGCQTFEGIAEGTFFRGSAWHFYNLGKYIERADQTTRVLFMACGLLAGAEGDALNTVRWNALLRSVAAYHAFRWVRPRGYKRRDIVLFMLYDEGFPRSVKLCTTRIESHLEDLVLRRGQPRVKAVGDACRRLDFTLDTGLGSRVNARSLRRFVDDLQRALIRVSDEIAAAYFGVR
jgi:uncharacterized alpha-E superfamily protein